MSINSGVWAARPAVVLAAGPVSKSDIRLIAARCYSVFNVQVHLCKPTRSVVPGGAPGGSAADGVAGATDCSANAAANVHLGELRDLPSRPGGTRPRQQRLESVRSSAAAGRSTPGGPEEIAGKTGGSAWCWVVLGRRVRRGQDSSGWHRPTTNCPALGQLVRRTLQEVSKHSQHLGR